jgi:polysaccharide biosynthesis/export protein
MRLPMHRLLNLAAALAVTLAACLLPAPALAQRPTPAEAEALLRARPDLVRQLRQRIAVSGMSPEQIRARLRAEGYPETLLDPYIQGAASNPEATLDEDVFGAVEALGIADSADVADLRALGRDTTLAGRARRAARGRDTLAEPDDTTLSLADTIDDGSGRYRLGTTRDGRRAPRPLTVFGLTVFDQRTTQFEPNLAGPVDANYRLGPGDQLVLILTGDVELSRSLTVTREGFVVIPQVGTINVANLTLGQLEDVLYTRLGQVYSGVRRGAGATTRFSVSVARLRSNQVYVLGDARAPGSYRVSSAGTALTALYAAGGPTANGSFRRIEIRRGGRVAQTLDLYDYLIRGDASRDPRLETGDVVFVPVHGPHVTITGEVERPAIYEIKPGETLRDVVQAAGGFTPRASTRRVQIIRIVPPAERVAAGVDRVTIDVTAESFEGTFPEIRLQAADSIRVFAVAPRVRNRITVLGSVWQPGTAAYTPRMKLSEALRLVGGLRPDAYLGQVLVSRVLPDSTRLQLRATLRDTLGNVVNDVTLEEDDEIRVFSISEFRPERYVAISGAVRHGGRFRYHDGMTVRDLVLLAGGLEESAYLREAEIARLPEDRANGVTATTFRVPLDSSYLVENAAVGPYQGPPGVPVASGGAPDVLVRPYDNVLILRQPDWALQRTVQVMGEVRFPGSYALQTKSERLSDIIQRAGGLTSEAYPEGVYFFRRRLQLGRIGIDLPGVLRSARHRDNLILLDGDSLFIPPFNGVVNVVGAVNSPVAVAYVPGKNMDFYIASAGGPNRRADEKRAYVTQPNGKVESRETRLGLIPDRVPEPRAGSTVAVPERDPNARRDYAQIAGSVAQIIASVVAIVAIALR